MRQRRSALLVVIESLDDSGIRVQQNLFNAAMERHGPLPLAVFANALGTVGEFLLNPRDEEEPPREDAELEDEDED